MITYIEAAVEKLVHEICHKDHTSVEIKSIAEAIQMLAHSRSSIIRTDLDRSRIEEEENRGW